MPCKRVGTGERGSGTGSKLVQESVARELLRTSQFYPPRKVDAILASSFGECGPEPWVASSLLSGLAKARRSDLAASVLEWLMRSGFETSVFEYSAVMIAHAKCGEWKEAIELLASMASVTVESDTVVCNAAISACGRSGAWPSALEILEVMVRTSMNTSTNTYNAALSSCEKVGAWLRALLLVDAMLKAQVETDTITQNAAISACGKGDAWMTSLGGFDAMMCCAIEADVITSSAAMSACGKAFMWSRTMELIRVAAYRTLVLDTVCCGAAISACEKIGLWKNAFVILGQIEQARLQVSTIAVSAAISACELCGDWAKALGLLFWMGQQEVRTNIITYNAIISACGKGDAWQLAIDILRKAHEVQLQVDVVTFSATISACRKGMAWGHAIALLVKMDSLTLEANVITLNAAIGSCESGRVWRETLSSLMGVRRRGLEPDLITFIGSVRASQMSERWEHALAVLRSAQCELDAASLCDLAWAFADLGVYDVTLMRTIADVAISRVNLLSLESLSDLAWAFASLVVADAVLFDALALRFTSRLKKLYVQGNFDNRSRFLTMNIGRMIWACRFANIGNEALDIQASAAVQRIGRALDAPLSLRGLDEAPAQSSKSAWDPVACEQAGEPEVLVDCSDLLVVLKPSDWDVDETAAASAVLSLSDMMQARSPPRRWAPLRDIEHRCGFLHRLDVPSSGLILVAKTYEAYYGLQLQLNAGSLARDYYVLGHGLWVSAREEVSTRVYESLARVTWSRVCRRGKPSVTRVKAAAHCTPCMRRGLAAAWEVELELALAPVALAPT